MKIPLSRWLDRLTGLVSALLARTGLRVRAGEEPTPVYALPSPRYDQHLSIPVRETTADDSAAREAELRGQFLARQDRWDELVKEIRDADLNRKATPGGTPVGELMAFGARSDVVLAAEHALGEGRATEESALTDGIRGLELIRRELPDDPYMAMILALAHVDIGWAWRGTGWNAQIPQMNRDKCVAHFERAAAVMGPHSGIELDSPLIAAAQCAMLAGQRNPQSRVSDDYEDLIDLDPRNHRHMRALGHHLLPRWFGSYEALEIQARRTAARTQDIWGDGGYTWVCFDAIAMDEAACAQVDVGFFIDGLRDIAAARPEQEMINLLSAYCAVAILQGGGASTEADLARGQIADCAQWLIRDHLKEVHPLVWAHALDGFDNNARVTSISRFAARGRRFALQAIGELFRDEIMRGSHITFTPAGPQFDPA